MATENGKGLIRRIKAIAYKIKRKRINQNLLTYIIMVMLATAAWIINKMGSTINASGNSHVEFYGLPSNSILVPGITTDGLSINFSAKGSSLLGLHGNLPNIRIDLSKLDIRTFPESDSTLKFVTDDDIRAQVESQLPADYHFISLKPDTIKLDFGISLRKKVPVVLDQKLSFAPQFRLASSPIINPDSVVISGSAMIVDTVQSISTELLEISDINESAQHKVRLLMPTGVSCALTATNILLAVEKFTERTMEVPIRQLNVPDSVNLRIFNQNAMVKFNVGWDKYNKITREMFQVAVDYKDLTGIIRPKNLSLKIIKSPDDKSVTNLTISPESVEYLIEKVEREEEK
ncbi:MAG: hypothetical protein MJZ66_05520 [Bacteroidales bacterium]|nr:hypothetical protein [Bacteroidales bacterium]